MNKDKNILRPIDLFIIVYNILMVIVAALYFSEVSVMQTVVMRHIIVIAIIILIQGAVADHSSSLTIFISDWYPILTLPLAYRWSGDFIHVIFPWEIDLLLNQFDCLLLGSESVVILQRLSSWWFTDLMQVSYCLFFIMILGSSYIFYKKHYFRDFADLRLSIVMALYGTYILSMLFPAHSPRFVTCPDLVLNGGWLTAQINMFISKSSYCGGSFPSGHAAASLIICLFVRHHAKGWFLPFMISTVLLLLSTLYGGYHYMADILGGFIHGWLAMYLSVCWNKWWQRDECPII